MHARPRAALAMAAALASFITLSTVAKPAQAAFQISNVGLQCSESLVVQEGDAYVLSCTGDLSLQGLGGQGSFQADTSITLNATGSLSLIDVLLQAPNIALNGATVSLNAGTTLTPMPGGVNDPRLTDPRLTDPGAASGSGGVVLVNNCNTCRGVAVERYATNGTSMGRQAYKMEPLSVIQIQSKGSAQVGYLADVPCPS